MIIFSTHVASLVQRLGARTVVTAGHAAHGRRRVHPQLPRRRIRVRPRAVGMFVMALGMGLTMTPMTELIMSSVPPRQGRRRLGDERHDPRGRHDPRRRRARQHPCRRATRPTSAQSWPHFRHPHGKRLRARWPARSASLMRSAAPQGAAIVDAAKSAWADGLHLSMLVGAGIVLVAAAIAARYLPGKLGGATDEAIDLDGFTDELDGLSLVAAD